MMTENMTTFEAGATIVRAITAGMQSFSHDVRRATWAIQEFGLAYRAARTEEHADWFCALPRWQRAVWIVAHGAYLT